MSGCGSAGPETVIPSGSEPTAFDSSAPVTTPVPVIITEKSGAQTPAATSPTDAPKEQAKYNDYNISIEFDPVTRRVYGTESVVYVNNTEMTLNRIYFNMYLNAFNTINIKNSCFQSFEGKLFKNGVDYGYINVVDASVDKEQASFEQKDTVLNVLLRKQLMPGEQVSLQLYFEAYIPKLNARTGANDAATWFGNFFPILAVYDENGWHTEPYYPAGDPFYSEIANYNVKISVPLGYNVFGTGTKELITADGKTTALFTAKMVRDFAFAVGDRYITKSIVSQNGTVISFHYFSETFNGADTILSAAKTAIDYFGDALADYPYPTLDIIETGLFFTGGMEYPQVVFIDSDSLRSSGIKDTIVHEIGHQWFYNIIGNNEIKEPWLDEGITMCVQQWALYSDEKINSDFSYDYTALHDMLKDFETKTMLQDLSVYRSWSEYYSINYTRAKLMVYSLSLKMGKEKFGEFLKLYYAKCAFKIADKDDFISVAEEVYGKSLTAFFDSWMSDYTLPPLNE